MTPERIAALEAAAAENDEAAAQVLRAMQEPASQPDALETVAASSPVAGRRFSRG